MAGNTAELKEWSSRNLSRMNPLEVSALHRIPRGKEYGKEIEPM